MKKILFLTLFCIISNTFGQIVSEEFSSKILNGKRKIVTYLPDNYSDKESYPLLVVLNANSLMEPTISGVRYFEYFENMPKCIILGIYNHFEDVAITPEIGTPSGNTAHFFKFVLAELVPYIQGKYTINDFKAMIASDEAGFFAKYYLALENPFFDAVITLNPKTQKSIYEPFSQSLGFIKKPIFYYVATTDMNDEAFYKNTQELDLHIKGLGLPENVNYYFEDLAGSSPNAVVLTGIARAFDLLFDAYKPITRKDFNQQILPLSGNFFGYLKEKYEKIENQLGIKKKPTLNDIMAIYEAIKLKDDWESLLQLSDFVKDNGYAKTAMPNYFLGEYYEKTGDNKRALKAYQKAYTQPNIDFITGDIINERLTKLKK